MTKDKQPDQVTIDYDELSLGDLETIEDMIGEEATRTALGGSPSPKALVALVYVQLRKSNPEISLDEIREMKLRTLSIDEPNPTEAGV